MNHDVIIALDFPSAQDVYAFLDKFQEEKPFVKIGMELFYAEGPDIVRQIKARGHKIFLDLKLHDIPNTVKSAMRVLSRLDVDMVNLHAAGTVNMMRAALEGLTREDGTRPMLLAVTQLTSTSEEQLHKELLISATMPETVKKYAQNAQEAGLDGVVCSPLEAALVKDACGPDFATVTPGIRFQEQTPSGFATRNASISKGADSMGKRSEGHACNYDSAADDQSRVMTPEKARLGGSDYIVVGRPIPRAADPVAAYRRCVKEFTGN